MDKETLIKIGLSEGEATVYLALLEIGESPAANLIKRTGLKRGTTYNMLNSLVEKGLAEEVRREKVARFRLEHPVKLREYFERIAANADFAQKILSTSLDSLISKFNLVNNKPGIQYLEGKEGVQKVVSDLLTSKTPIYLYADFAAVQKYIPEIQEMYAKKQKGRGIIRKAILIDSKEWRTTSEKNDHLYAQDIAPTKYIKEKIDPFHAVMEIYDGKIAYITLSDNGITSTIIRDEGIYKMHSYLFEKLWNSLPE